VTTGSAHPSAKNSIPNVVPTSYRHPGSNRSNGSPSADALEGRCKTLIRINFRFLQGRPCAAMLLPRIATIREMEQIRQFYLSRVGP
jgi:hypothetical protein